MTMVSAILSRCFAAKKAAERASSSDAGSSTNAREKASVRKRRDYASEKTGRCFHALNITDFLPETMQIDIAF